MTTITFTCQCGKETHIPINLGSLVAKNRWAKIPKSERSKAMSKLAKGNKNKANWKARQLSTAKK